MATLRILSPNLSLASIRSYIVVPLQQCWMYPVTLAYTPPLEELLAEYSVVSAAELAFSDALDKAQAQVYATDGGLNAFACKVSKTVLTLTADDRSHPLYTLFFGNKSLSAFRRPILGSQLEAMRKWLPSLENSEHPPLKALAAELPALIDAADAAADAKGIAEQKKKEFRDVGDRRKFVDKVNAARRSLWAELGALPSKNVGLPPNFAEQFFRRDAPDEDEPTIESVQREIDGLAEQIEAKQSLVESLKQQATEQLAAEEALKAKEEKLGAMEKENAARLAELEAFRAEVEAARAA